MNLLFRCNYFGSIGWLRVDDLRVLGLVVAYSTRSNALLLLR